MRWFDVAWRGRVHHRSLAGSSAEARSPLTAVIIHLSLVAWSQSAWISETASVRTGRAMAPQTPPRRAVARLSPMPGVA